MMGQRERTGQVGKLLMRSRNVHLDIVAAASTSWYLILKVKSCRIMDEGISLHKFNENIVLVHQFRSSACDPFADVL